MWASGVERDSGSRRAARESEVELEGASLVGVLATVAIATAALVLAASPAAIATRLVALPPEWVGTGLGCLGAAVGGVKLIAMAWAVGGRLSGAHPPRVAVAAAD